MKLRFGTLFLLSSPALAEVESRILLDLRTSVQQNQIDADSPKTVGTEWGLQRFEWDLSPKQAEVVNLSQGAPIRVSPPAASAAQWNLRLSMIPNAAHTHSLELESTRSLAWAGLPLGEFWNIQTGVLGSLQGTSSVGGELPWAPVSESNLSATYLEKNEMGVRASYFLSEMIQWDMQVGRANDPGVFRTDGYDVSLRALLSYGVHKSSISFQSEHRPSAAGVGWRTEILSQNRYENFYNSWQAVVWRPAESVTSGEMKLGLLWQAAWVFSWGAWVIRGELERQKNGDYTDVIALGGPQFRLWGDALLLKSDYTMKVRMYSSSDGYKGLLNQQVLNVGILAPF